jgi:hypothetical protein
MPSRLYEQTQKWGKNRVESTKQANGPIRIPYRVSTCPSGSPAIAADV